MNDCLPSVQACAIRVARLDASGVPAPGASNLYTTHGIVELTATPEFTEGEEINAQNGQGVNCVSYKQDDQITRATIELTICRPDPELTELLTGGSVLTDGDAVGYKAPALNSPLDHRVSIELWSKRIDDSGDLDAEFPYYWWVFPRVRSLRMGARRWFNGALENPFTGFAIENPNWHDGPLNDWPVDSDSWFQYIPTTELPADDCGYQTLVAS